MTESRQQNKKQIKTTVSGQLILGFELGTGKLSLLSQIQPAPVATNGFMFSEDCENTHKQEYVTPSTTCKA